MGLGAVAQWFKLLPMMLASQMGSSMGLGCSTSSPAPYKIAWKSYGTCPEYMGTDTHMGGLEFLLIASVWHSSGRLRTEPESGRSLSHCLCNSAFQINKSFSEVIEASRKKKQVHIKKEETKMTFLSSNSG